MSSQSPHFMIKYMTTKLLTNSSNYYHRNLRKYHVITRDIYSNQHTCSYLTSRNPQCSKISHTNTTTSDFSQNQYYSTKTRISQNIIHHIARRYQTTYHTRPLPSHLVALSSSLGKTYFREALDQGGLECYFPLSEQFITQSDPSFCSVSSLAMTLNALKFDPMKVWKGAWRWVSEETLLCESTKICGHNIENIKENGMNFSQFETLGHCHGISIQSFRVKKLLDTDNHTTIEPLDVSNNPSYAYSIESFRDIVDKTSSSSKANTFVIVNFSRKVLGQTGDGHFSPIGGYHKQKDLVLIMDVARFKYPPYWVSLTELWDSMAAVDNRTDQSRGYFILSTSKRNESPSIESSHHNCQDHNHDHHHNHSHTHSHTHVHNNSHSSTTTSSISVDILTNSQDKSSSNPIESATRLILTQ